MYIFHKSFLSVFLILIATTNFAQPLVIFDTDIGGDADDLAALAMLHNLHNHGECKLLAIMSWTTEVHAVPAIDAISRYYGNHNIPIGVRKMEPYSDTNSYNVPIANQFTHKLCSEQVPDATSLYRKILAKATDHSITIITVGPLYNIKALLESGPDKFSNLTGKELVREKVKEFSIMGGGYPESENEWNFNGNMPGVTRFVIQNIDRPITFSGYEIGIKIKTGAILNERESSTPLYQGFMHFSSHASWMKESFQGEILDNSSYDQTSVIYAVRNEVGKLWSKSEPGFCNPDDHGGNTWKSDPAGTHTYLKLTEDPEKIAALIEAIMLDEER